MGFHGRREPGRRGTGPGPRKADFTSNPPARHGGPDTDFPRWPARRSPPHPRSRPAAGAAVAGVDGRHRGLPRPARPTAAAHRPEPPAAVPPAGRPEHRARPLHGGWLRPAVPRRSVPLPARPATGAVGRRRTLCGIGPERRRIPARPMGPTAARAPAGPSGGGGGRPWCGPTAGTWPWPVPSGCPRRWSSPSTWWGRRCTWPACTAPQRCSSDGPGVRMAGRVVTP